MLQPQLFGLSLNFANSNIVILAQYVIMLFILALFLI